MDAATAKRLPQTPKSEPLSDGVKQIALARTIRWIGWGFGESLIPLFIFYFSRSFAEAGLFKSIYDIATLLTLPIIGAWADRTPAKSLIVVALLLYPLVGLSYFLAGVFGAAIFIVLARALNGFCWGLEDMGVSTYYRRMSSNKTIGTSFGYIDSWSNFGWIIAALIGMFLVAFVPIHSLLLMISPFALIALFVALRAPKDTIRKSEDTKPFVMRSYKKIFDEWRSWDGHLWLLSTLVLFSSVIDALMWFFIPIDAYINGAKPEFVVLLMVVAAVPILFGYNLGKITDKGNKYWLIAIGLVATALIMGGVALFPQYLIKLIASFLLGIVLELFSVIEKSLVTTLGPPETYGQRGGAFESVVTFGDLAAPIILGVALDILGFASVSWIVAGVALVLSVGYAMIRSKTPGGLKAT